MTAGSTQPAVQTGTCLAQLRAPPFQDLRPPPRSALLHNSPTGSPAAPPQVHPLAALLRSLLPWVNLGQAPEYGADDEAAQQQQQEQQEGEGD